MTRGWGPSSSEARPVRRSASSRGRWPLPREQGAEEGPKADDEDHECPPARGMRSRGKCTGIHCWAGEGSPVGTSGTGFFTGTGGAGAVCSAGASRRGT